MPMFKRALARVVEILHLFPQRQAFLLMAISAAVGLVIQIYSYFHDRLPPPTDQCQMLKTSILSQITAAGKCDSDSDCLVASFGCPFNCNVTVNKHSVVTPITHDIESYNNHCGFCVDQCAVMPLPTCVKHQCQLPVAP